MSAPLQFDSQMREAVADLATAEGHHRAALAESVAATRTAARVVTDRELKRWANANDKLWQAQFDLAARHGAIWNSETPNRGVIRTQLRRSWLGNVTGIALPLFVMGGSVFDHGFLLPVFWMAALMSDITGRASCLRRAGVLEHPHANTRPNIAGTQLSATLNRARETDDWFGAWPSIQQIAELDADIHARDRSLRRGQHYGQKIGALSLAILIVTVIAFQVEWTLLPAALIAVFGAACWNTSRSYAAGVEQPPYPPPGSIQRIQRNVHYESLLARVPRQAFSSHEIVAQHTTTDMLKQRQLLRALKQTARAQVKLEDARWHVAILQSERTRPR